MLEHTFQSRHLNRAVYDPDTMQLDVQFVNGAVYRYSDVPQTVIDTFFQTGSSQEYFNDKIKSAYRYTKIVDGYTPGGRTSRRRF